MRHLEEAASELPQHSGQVLTLINGPAWRNQAAYALFHNNVYEGLYFKEWDVPAGLGICPLDIIYQMCDVISNWLSMADNNVVVRASCHDIGAEHACAVSCSYVPCVLPLSVQGSGSLASHMQCTAAALCWVSL